MKKNNHINNLEWCTHSQNTLHAFEIGLKCHRGEKQPRSILKEKDIRDIRELLKYKSPIEISVMYGVVPGTIYHIKNGDSWSHVK